MSSPAAAHIPTAVVIEDDQAVRDILIEVSESAGFTAIGAVNGVGGVEALRAHRPRITTVDVNMPGIDGFETVKRLRAISETYIVLVTARTDESDAVLGLSLGADDYVTKPFARGSSATGSRPCCAGPAASRRAASRHAARRRRSKRRPLSSTRSWRIAISLSTSRHVRSAGAKTRSS